MVRTRFLLAALMATTMSCVAASAEQIAVKHIQRPDHQFMVTRSESGKVIAHLEFEQTIKGDEVTVHLATRFLDGSIDEETSTFSQKGVFRLLRNHRVQRGPFFAKPVDFSVDAVTGTLTSRMVDKSGKDNVDNEHMKLPDDLANGMIGTLLENVPSDTAPFRVGLVAPVGGGRLIQLLISRESEQTFEMNGRPHKAIVFRVHPEIGGFAGMFAPLVGMQPKDVMVWIREGNDPEVVRIVGQLGGAGPVVSSELEGASFQH